MTGQTVTPAEEKRAPRPKRLCIFCGAVADSKEHVWPDWMKPLLPIGQANQTVTEENFVDGTKTVRPGVLNRKGDARAQKLKVVCAKCNNGWMSQLQSAAKPILLPLLSCEDAVITVAQQETVAAWATMFAMVLETTNSPKYAATSPAQRTAFMNDKKPPQFWSFWLAPFLDAACPALQMGYSMPVSTDAAANESSPHKAQLTICGAGAVSFLIFRAATAEAYQNFEPIATILASRAGYIRLWPTVGRDVRPGDSPRIPLTTGMLKGMQVDFVNAFKEGVMPYGDLATTARQPSTPLEQRHVEQWLGDLGCRFRQEDVPGMAWQLTDINFPAQTMRRVTITRPLPPDSYTVVSSKTLIGGPFLRDLQSLDAARQTQVLAEFLATIKRPWLSAETYQVPPHVVPAGFITMLSLHDKDFTSRELLRRALEDLNEVDSAGIEFLQRHVPPTFPAPQGSQ